MELDMAFDGEDEDEGDEGDSGRSGSAELEMDMDDDGEVDPEWKKLALGTGSGGVKGRRAGMVFKCENCAKVGACTARELVRAATLTGRSTDIQVV
jgi:hypothetical protein